MEWGLEENVVNKYEGISTVEKIEEGTGGKGLPLQIVSVFEQRLSIL